MAGSTGKYRIWGVVFFLAAMAAPASYVSAENKKDIPASKSSAEKSKPVVSDPNLATAAVKAPSDPNDPNAPARPIPIQAVLPDPNTLQSDAVSSETNRLILSRSIGAIAASNWITQGKALPQTTPQKGKMTVAAKTYYYPYWGYERNWLWDCWYSDNLGYPYKYPAGGEYFNDAAVRMSLDVNLSFEFGGWTTSYLDGPYYKP